VSCNKLKIDGEAICDYPGNYLFYTQKLLTSEPVKPGM
jgi:hypothetical protein